MAISDSCLNINLNSLNVDLLDAEFEKEVKIIILGEVNSGKSSLIKIFFGNESPKEVLSEQNEPTIGAEIRVFQQKNTKIGVFDLAGQEIDEWLSAKRATELFFEADGIFFFFNLRSTLNKKEVIKITSKLKHVLKNISPKAKCIIILNKYDEFVKKEKGALKKANKIKTMVEEISRFPTYISSLIPNYYPLLKMKLDRILAQMPVDPQNISFSSGNSRSQPNITNPIEVGGHVIPMMTLADATHLAQDEYNEKISRSEILRSEFNIL